MVQVISSPNVWFWPVLWSLCIVNKSHSKPGYNKKYEATVTFDQKNTYSVQDLSETIKKVRANNFKFLRFLVQFPQNKQKKICWTLDIFSKGEYRV